MNLMHWMMTAVCSCFVVVSGGFIWAADESPVATVEFGDVSIELGMGTDDVIAALDPEFLLRMMPPDPQFPNLVEYSVHHAEELPRPLTSLAGHITMQDGKLKTASRRVMSRKETLDSQELMTHLTDLLSSRSKTAGATVPEIRFDDGMSQGARIGNRELCFVLGPERVTVRYYDSPGASQRVTLTVQIGEN